MSPSPQVSVIIPVFCGAATITRALDSVAAQAFSDLEIVVIDDGSTDQTVDIVGRWGRDRERFTLLRHPQNRGAGGARNSGIAAAHGRWIAFLDADDAWKPEKLARQIAALDAAGPDVRACASGYHLHKDGRELTVSLTLAPDEFRREILFGCTISPGTTLLVERRVFEELGGFDEAFRRLEDWDWLLRFAERYAMAFVAEPLADVYLTTRKPWHAAKAPDPVLDAIRHIGTKHLRRLKSPTRRRQLRSSLLVEKAATLYRRGRPLPAAGYVLAAFFVYPARNAAFFRTLWWSASGLLR